jgi:hypothetical protein
MICQVQEYQLSLLEKVCLQQVIDIVPIKQLSESAAWSDPKLREIPIAKP